MRITDTHYVEKCFRNTIMSSATSREFPGLQRKRVPGWLLNVGIATKTTYVVIMKILGIEFSPWSELWFRFLRRQNGNHRSSHGCTQMQHISPLLWGSSVQSFAPESLLGDSDHQGLHSSNNISYFLVQTGGCSGRKQAWGVSVG